MKTITTDPLFIFKFELERGISVADLKEKFRGVQVTLGDYSIFGTIEKFRNVIEVHEGKLYYIGRFGELPLWGDVVTTADTATFLSND